MVLPVFFIPVITRFPVGLLMYWMTTNLWTVGQGIITRRMAPKPAPPPKRSSRTPPKEEPAAALTDGARGRVPPRPRPLGRPRRAASSARRRRAGGERGARVEGGHRVEATGETVGEAKWHALRELEQRRAGARQGGRPLRGALGGRARPARASATRRRGWLRPPTPTQLSAPPPVVDGESRARDGSA